MGVSICGKNLKHTVVNSQDTDIKGTTTKIKDKNVLLSTLLVQTISDCGSSWFINNPSNIKASNNTSILGCLSLSIVKISCAQDKKTTQS